MESSSVQDEAKREEIERWCQEQIKRGSDFFFDPTLFRLTLAAKAKEFDFPLEVGMELVTGGLASQKGRPKIGLN